MSLVATSAGVMYPISLTGGFDSDALAFINAVISSGYNLSGTEQEAINALVIGFKNNGTWSKKTAVYPFVGNTAASHKWNLKDPRDLDAARRLVFTGAWVHSLTGIAGNATDTAANTFITLGELTAHANNDSLMSVWSRTNIQSNAQVDVGVADVPAGGSWTLLSNIDNQEVYFQWGIPQTAVYMGNPGSIGHFVGKLYNTEMASFKNGVKLAWRIPPIASIVNTTTYVYVGATGLVGGPPGYWAGREYSYAEVSLFGYTDAEVTADYNTIAAFQAALSRQAPPVFLAETLAILALLFTLGIVLTHMQQLALDELLRNQPAPAPAARKARRVKQPSVRDLNPDVLELLRSMGHKI